MLQTGFPMNLMKKAVPSTERPTKLFVRLPRDLENEFHFNTAISAVMELVNLMLSLVSDESDVQYCITGN